MEKQNKDNKRMGCMLIIIMLIITLFLFLQVIGCLPFSPWVMANGGEKFLCILK